MPYSIKKKGVAFVLINKDTGKTISRHKTREKAKAAIRAIEASKHARSNTRT
jgi:hypothetical protein